MPLLVYHITFYLSLFIILSTAIPLIRNDYWVFRVFEYPRLQKLILNALLLAVMLIFYFPANFKDTALAAALTLNLIYLCVKIYPFTPLAPKQLVKSINTNSTRNNIKLLVANVFQDNQNSAAYHQLIKDCSPDLVLMVETNRWWEAQMRNIEAAYPYQIKEPLENTYGMMLYSRLQLADGAVQYLVENDIPSIEVNVSLLSGQQVKLYCLHPKPPVPQESPTSTERDREILLVGQKAKNSPIPVIVAGDLNDVAWSYTTELFSKTSGLLDPRKGRGFFNSFNAKYFFLRFPLDHIFCSSDFSLKSICTLNNCGSDHFPICVELQFDPRAELINEEPEATQEDMELAEEKIQKEA
ncbi:endonuclease/exonuclease/phosphatase family protein [Mucilaginibacter sp. CSA2-8R]|uniref:endonuclease/exonuclease/phosphatase family protein n=1 Tax=Mucilaginibacter sp. CSA2-8R TaxID=3141542 RepID=UPI00315D680C